MACQETQVHYWPPCVEGMELDNPKDEFERFSGALRHALRVSPSALKARIEADKQKRAAKREDRQKLMARRAISRSKRTAHSSD